MGICKRFKSVKDRKNITCVLLSHKFSDCLKYATRNIFSFHKEFIREIRSEKLKNFLI